MKDWNKKFTSPFTDDEVVTLLRLSAAIDELWEAQIQLRKEVGTKTQDALSIFGYTDDAEDSHTTIGSDMKKPDAITCIEADPLCQHGLSSDGQRAKQRGS